MQSCAVGGPKINAGSATGARRSLLRRSGLPLGPLRRRHVRTLAEAAHAIKSMQVRGAPLIGAAAAYGMCLALRADTSDEQIERAYAMLHATRPTANLIKDFSPAAGDRLVLKAANYGPEVLALRNRMIVRDGANPQPQGTAPQLLFAGQGSLLRFDPDGEGPMVAYVIAILRGFDHLPTDAIAVKKRH